MMRALPTPLLAGIAVALLGLTAAVAQSGTPTVGQKDRTFSTDTLSVSPGTTVRFVNDDTVAHNVVVRDPAGGAAQTSPLQKPGDQTEVAFRNAGDHDVRCAIHPRMRMTVKVQ